MFKRELTTLERDILVSLLENDIWYEGCEWGQDDVTRDTLSELAWDGYVTCNDLDVYFMNEVQKANILKTYEFFMCDMPVTNNGFAIH